MNNSQATVHQYIFGHQDRNVYIAGPGGTGKSYLLGCITETLREEGIQYEIVAPTGIAAVNASGRTIQSTFGIRPESQDNVPVTSLDLSFDVLIIDEISMVSKDLFEQINDIMKMYKKSVEPMGGVRVIAVGDRFQLRPPTGTDVLGEQVYSSKVWRDLRFVRFELNYPVRQSNMQHFMILNDIRKGIKSQRVKDYLNNPERTNVTEDYEYVPHLYHNKRLADRHNTRLLNNIPGESVTFHRVDSPNASKYNELVAIPKTVTLKVGARIMCIKNIYAQYALNHNVYNGQLGTVTSIEDGLVTADMDSGYIHTFTTETWELKGEYVKQIPLQLAWGITIVKSQGITLDKAVLYVIDGIKQGYTYVGMSRVRDLNNLKVIGYNDQGTYF